MPADRTSAQVAAARLREAADQALDRRRDDLHERNSTGRAMRAHDYLVRSSNRARLVDACNALADDPRATAATARAWARLARALSDPDLDKLPNDR